MTSFVLPGENQKIDRVMEMFSECYVTCNPGGIFNEESAYIFSFAIIMLQTTLHNPSVRYRMTLEQFVIQTNGMPETEELPSDLVIVS